MFADAAMFTCHAFCLPLPAFTLLFYGKRALMLVTLLLREHTPPARRGRCYYVDIAPCRRYVAVTDVCRDFTTNTYALYMLILLRYFDADAAVVIRRGLL